MTEIKGQFFSLTRQLSNQNFNDAYPMKRKEILSNEFGTFFLNEVENIVTKISKIEQNKEINTIEDYTSLTANKDPLS